MSLTRAHTPTTASRSTLSPWVRITLVLAGISGLAAGAHWVAGHWITPSNPPRRQAIAALGTWAPPIAWGAGIAAALAATTALALPLIRTARGGTSAGSNRGTSQFQNALAHQLRIPPDTISHTATRSTGRLARGKVRYPRHHGPGTDPTEAVLKALTPHALHPLAATHTPQKRRIDYYPAPPDTPPHWWDEYPLLARLHDWLDELLPGLDILRERTHIDTLDTDPEAAKITFRYDKTYRDIGPKFTAQVHDVLDKKVPSPTGAWTLIWVPNDNMLIVTPGVALPEHVPIPHTPPQTGELPHWSLPVGIRTGGRLALWQPEQHPHLLVAGATGGGKSSLMRTLIVMALIYGWEVYIADPKMLGYRGMFGTGWGLTHDRIATRGHTMEAMILAVVAETDRRYQLCEWGLASPDDFWPILLIVDENTEALPRMTRSAQQRARQAGEKPPKESEAVDGEWSIARLGREVGIYIVLGHQRPDVSYIKGEARDNMPSVWAAGRMSDIGIKMLFDAYHVDQHVTIPIAGPDGQIDEKHVKGRGTVNLGNGIEPVQGYWTPNTTKPNECPPKSDEEHRMNHLAGLATTAQTHARHLLLPGITRIDPAAEEAAARAEWRTWQHQRHQQQTPDNDNSEPNNPNASTTPLPTLNNDQQPHPASGHQPGASPPPAFAPAASPPRQEQPADGGDADHQSHQVAPASEPAAPAAPPGWHQPTTNAGASAGTSQSASQPEPDASNHQAGEQDTTSTAAACDAAEAPSLLVQAAEAVATSQLGSTAMLQRTLSIGHARAANLMRQLETHGIVGQGRGTTTRHVLITPDTDIRQHLHTTTTTSGRRHDHPEEFSADDC